MNKICRILYVVGFLVIVAAGVLFCLPQYGKRNALIAQRDALNRRIEEKKSEIKVVHGKQNRFRTDREFVESLARENCRAKSDETVFIFND